MKTKSIWVYQCTNCKKIYSFANIIDVLNKTCRECNSNKPNLDFIFNIDFGE